MADLLDALEWLNIFDISHLRNSTRERLERIRSVRLNSDEIANEIEALLTESGRSGDPWEYPEVLVHSAIIEYRNRHLNTARGHLHDAVRAYDGHYHRRAIAQWMLGFVEWELLENDAATSNWEAARESFTNMSEWYLKRAEQSLFATQVSRAGLFEEAFRWLNHHEASHLKRTPRELQTIISKRLDEGLIDDEAPQDTWVIYQLMYKLIDETRTSTDYMETAEAYIECGIAAYRMGHLSEAIRYLELGINHYHPGTHHQAVSKWLLGIVQWDLEGYQDLARRNWQEAIESFEQAALQAQYRNRMAQARWYSEILHVMQDALQEKIRSLYA
jgi:tetratricopeptide (TPR) repeat protein